MTFWNTLAAVIWGLAIYNFINFIVNEIIERIEDRRATKRFEEALTELEAYWASLEEKKPAKKKAVAKKK